MTAQASQLSHPTYYTVYEYAYLQYVLGSLGTFWKILSASKKDLPYLENQVRFQDQLKTWGQGIDESWPSTFLPPNATSAAAAAAHISLGYPY